MFPVELRGTRAKTLMWAPEHEIEQAAFAAAAQHR